MTLVECYPIGVITMIDNGRSDEKIIAITYSDPTYMSYTSVDELPKHIFQELKHFFSVYKQLEGKKTEANNIAGPTEAIAIIQEAMDSYQKKFGSAQNQEV